MMCLLLKFWDLDLVVVVVEVVMSYYLSIGKKLEFPYSKKKYKPRCEVQYLDQISITNKVNVGSWIGSI